MRFFLSYKYSDLSKDTLNATVQKLVNHIRGFGHNIFCNLEKDDFYHKNNYNTEQIMNDCFSMINRSTRHITFVTSAGLSEGMLIETGYAKKQNNPILLLINKDVYSNSLKAIVDDMIIYNDFDDLLEQLTPYLAV